MATSRIGDFKNGDFKKWRLQELATSRIGDFKNGDFKNGDFKKWRLQEMATSRMASGALKSSFGIVSGALKIYPTSFLSLTIQMATSRLSSIGDFKRIRRPQDKIGDFKTYPAPSR